MNFRSVRKALREREEASIKALADALHCKASKDGAGDWCVLGRIDKAQYIVNTIHSDGDGYSVMVGFESPRGLSSALPKLDAFMESRAEGETEVVMYLPRLPNRKQAGLLRRILGIRKVRVLSDTHKAKLVAASATRRFQSSRPGSTEEINGEKTRERAAAVSG